MITEKDVSRLDLAHKLELMEWLWRDISRQEESVIVPGWHKSLLDERVQAVAEGKAQFQAWSTAKAELDDECS